MTNNEKEILKNINKNLKNMYSKEFKDVEIISTNRMELEITDDDNSITHFSEELWEELKKPDFNYDKYMDELFKKSPPIIIEDNWGNTQKYSNNHNTKKYKKVRHSKIYKLNDHFPLSTFREMKRRIGRKTWRKLRKRLSFTDYKRFEYYIPWIRQKARKRNPYKSSNNTDIYKKETTKYCPNCGFKLEKENIIQNNIDAIMQLGRSAGKHMLEVTH